MKTIVVIPARGESKRLPKKNIKLLGGIPLIAHSILYAQANKAIIDAIYVSTDDEEIKEITLKYGANVINRPKIISGDYEPTISAIQHTLVSIGDDIENIVTLQATNPLRPKNLLREAFEIYKKGEHESLITISRNYKKLGFLSQKKFTPLNYTIGQRSQDIKELFFENGLLYISKKKLILEGAIFNSNSYPFLVDNHSVIDIDTQTDLNYAEYLISKK